jgi:tRNA dimethylallyltransferase
VPEPLLVILLGPTASGKTALSLALAQQFGGEILSCDSVAVYRGMDVGSAKPSPAQRARVPHHLLDLVPPSHPYTAGDYLRDGRSALAEVSARGRLPIVTGGTGLYLRALLQGLFPGPPRSPSLRTRLEAHSERRGPGSLHRLLRRLDPPSAARIHPNDQPKLIRALEVAVLAREPLSAALAGTEARDPLTGYRLLRIGLQPPRAELYRRINARAAAMFSEGLLEETRALLTQYGPVAALRSLGYREAAAVLAGTLPLPQAIAQAQQGHRNYAKRQLTWFRREPDTLWLPTFGDEPSALAAAIAAVQQAGPLGGNILS